ncbi:hypothetical protein [Kluyvera genomosp. 1]|uniref:hypothetical protein n=1 Tax=Kluyvera genomosp. 1 TaxID=2774053 RepID=UPI00068CBBC3|nr:hypothetical protein [Kluyvera genomosp. 1]
MKIKHIVALTLFSVAVPTKAELLATIVCLDDIEVLHSFNLLRAGQEPVLTETLTDMEGTPTPTGIEYSYVYRKRLSEGNGNLDVYSTDGKVVGIFQRDNSPTFTVQTAHKNSKGQMIIDLTMPHCQEKPLE